MSQRTDVTPPQAGPEFSNEFLMTLSGLTVAILVVIFGIEHGVGLADSYRSVFQLIFAFPWIIAGGITIENGLDHFSGTSSEVLTGATLWGPLIPLLVIGVVGSTLFLYLMTSKDHRSGISHVRRVGYIIGLILCSTYFFTLIPISIIQWSVRDSLRKSQAVQQNKDWIIQELATVTWRLRENMILPAGDGRGDIRSFDLQKAVGESMNAAYGIEWEGDAAVIVARSKVYPDAAVRVTVNTNGRPTAWDYIGRFD